MSVSLFIFLSVQKMGAALRAAPIFSKLLRPLLQQLLGGVPLLPLEGEMDAVHHAAVQQVALQRLIAAGQRFRRDLHIRPSGSTGLFLRLEMDLLGGDTAK